MPAETAVGLLLGLVFMIAVLIGLLRLVEWSGISALPFADPGNLLADPTTWIAASIGVFIAVVIALLAVSEPSEAIDPSTLREISGKTWIPAPPADSQERDLAAITAQLHNRITASPAWLRIVKGQHSAPIDLGAEVMGILQRLREIGEVREELGTPTGRNDPIQAQHEALDGAVISVVQRIEALADYADQLEQLERETTELNRLERAERLNDRVLDVVAENAADSHQAVDPADLSDDIASTRAAITATTQAMEVSAAALTSKTDAQELHDRTDG